MDEKKLAEIKEQYGSLAIILAIKLDKQSFLQKASAVDLSKAYVWAKKNGHDETIGIINGLLTKTKSIKDIRKALDEIKHISTVWTILFHRLAELSRTIYAWKKLFALSKIMDQTFDPLVDETRKKIFASLLPKAKTLKALIVLRELTDSEIYVEGKTDEEILDEKIFDLLKDSIDDLIEVVAVNEKYGLDSLYQKKAMEILTS